MPSDLFERFMHDYKKSYASEEEKSYRQSIFAKTLQRIEELNAVEPFRPHGINQFADLTTEEFAARFLMPKGALAATQQARLAQAGTLDLEFGALPDTFDWRQRLRHHPCQEPGAVRKLLGLQHH